MVVTSSLISTSSSVVRDLVDDGAMRFAARIHARVDKVTSCKWPPKDLNMAGVKSTTCDTIYELDDKGKIVLDANQNKIVVAMKDGKDMNGNDLSIAIGRECTVVCNS